MHLIKNGIANYLGRFYISLIGVCILPLYFNYLGSAAFGLVSLFGVLQVFLSMLDVGLTPALSREIACHRDDESTLFEIKQLLHSLEILFFIVSLVIILGTSLSSPWIAHKWLKIDKLIYAEVIYCIIIMGIMIGLRWFSDLYRSCVSSMEHQVWSNIASIVIVSLQYLGGYGLLRWVTRSPIYFFEYQLLISFLDVLIFKNKLYNLLLIFPQSASRTHISWASIKKVLPFASSTAYTVVIWILIIQLDKLLLSHILPLSHYGYFALAMMLSGSIFQFSGPLSLAIMPRMAFLYSQGNKKEMLEVYRNATQMMAVIVLPLAGMIALFSNEIIYFWTGDMVAATWAEPVLFWYALGNGISSIGAFQYYLQYAHGKLKMHVIFNTIIAAISIPLITFFAFKYGAIGTAVFCFLISSLTFLIWPPIIHRKYAPGIHRDWLLKDLLPIFLTVITLLFISKKFSTNIISLNRQQGLITIISLTIIIWICCALSSKACRNFLSLYFQNRKNVIPNIKNMPL